MVLRLIHCLQRERGASCSFAGSRVNSTQNGSDVNDGPNPSQHIQNVRLARAATNSAMKGFYRSELLHSSSCDVASSLLCVRQFVDEGHNKSLYEKSCAIKYQFVHYVVKEFGSFISYITRVYVVDIIVSSFELMQESEKVPVLKLLLSFVELKESLGIERASLTGIMAIGNSQWTCNTDETSASERCKDEHQMKEIHELNAPGLSFIINDVVMVVENQHRILLELQKQSGLQVIDRGYNKEPNGQVEISTLDPNLLRLIGKSIKQSDEMQSLQDHIRKDFDLNSFQHVSSLLLYFQ